MDATTTPGNARLGVRWPATTGGRVALGGYALLGYLASMGCLAYLAGFLADRGVPRDVDSGRTGPVWGAVAVDLALVAGFGLQHSVMARPWFKRWWSRAVRGPAQRSSYVLAASAMLILLFWGWQPLPATIWQVRGLPGDLLLVVYAGCTVLAVVATFQVSHADLFGLRPAWYAVTGRPYAEPGITRNGMHRVVRHPIAAALLLLFWVTPHLTAGHLLLAAGMTGYIAIGTRCEETDLVAAVGPAYGEYRRQVPAVVPRRKRAAVAPDRTGGLGPGR